MLFTNVLLYRGKWCTAGRHNANQTTSKITIPGRKEVYRLLAADGVPILDIMIKDGEEQPQPGVPILARYARYWTAAGPAHIMLCGKNKSGEKMTLEQCGGGGEFGTSRVLDTTLRLSGEAPRSIVCTCGYAQPFGQQGC